MADIAVLQTPDYQDLNEQALAYEALTEDVLPFDVAAAWPQEFEPKRVTVRNREWDIPKQTPGRVSVLALTGEWIPATAFRYLAGLAFTSIQNPQGEDELIIGGMSGSPILDANGAAIGLVSCTMMHPILLEALPPRLCIDGEVR
jgi:hypothetical protein